MQNLSKENKFDLDENELVRGNSVSYKWFHTKTRFDGEAKSNSENVARDSVCHASPSLGISRILHVVL